MTAIAHSPTHQKKDGPADVLLPTYKRAPVEFVRGAGVELFDIDGKAYLDFASGIAVNALGYGDEGVEAAMRQAMESGLIHVSNLFPSAPGRALAAELVRRSKFAEQVFFCNSGAEANEGAFKFARRWARSIAGPEKHEIIALRGAFHGRLFATLAATDRPGYRAPFRPLAGGVSVVERDLKEIEAAMQHGTVCALIAEPVQGEGGVRVLDTMFLRGLRELTQRYNVALIFDEIQCGLGRTGAFFAYEHAGIAPDMVTIAKPLAAGLPMGAILVNAAIARTIQPGDHGTTFGGGPFVATVALHVVERLGDAALLARVREGGVWLGESLRGIASRVSGVRAVRGTGFMWGIDVQERAADVVARALEAGLVIITAGEHTLRLLPPLISTQQDLARGLSMLEDVLR
ncbi:MAG: acetylornithine transaminase [Gemmatimonadota bacterium]|nr:acetylornithine transaminase [Gemmatimonadota bacterium]